MDKALAGSCDELMEELVNHIGRPVIKAGNVDRLDRLEAGMALLLQCFQAELLKQTCRNIYFEQELDKYRSDINKIKYASEEA